MKLPEDRRGVIRWVRLTPALLEWVLSKRTIDYPTLSGCIFMLLEQQRKADEFAKAQVPRGPDA